MGEEKRLVPVWEKELLSVKEAAAYFGIGENKIREMTDGQTCQYVLWVGNKRLIKRRMFQQVLEQQYSI